MLRPNLLRLSGLFALFLGLSFLPASSAAGQGFSFEDILSPPWPAEMVSARTVDRIAWIAMERGRRNVYTAVGPDFAPIRLTEWWDDEGQDLTDLRISDDGEVVVFVRGHFPNGAGWVANPSSDPRGAEEAIWAVSTAGGDPWRVVEGSNPVLSPDGRWVLFVKEGQIHRAPKGSPGRRMKATWAPSGDHTGEVSRSTLGAR